MLNVKRGPGRPPKVRPEAEEVEEPKAETPAPERLIEVVLMRKYAPHGQPQEVKNTVPPGTVMKLTQPEATRLLKIGVARATDNTFD